MFKNKIFQGNSTPEYDIVQKSKQLMVDIIQNKINMITKTEGKIYFSVIA